MTATEAEIKPLLAYLIAQGEQHSFQTYQLHGLQIDIIFTGIGVLQSTYALTDYVGHRHPEGWIQAGIGGAFDDSIRMGEVYQVESEMLADFGAEDQDGRILDPFELGWNDPDAFPFSNGVMLCPFESPVALPMATGMTTWHAHGASTQIQLLRQQPHGQIENMEGAAFFYVSLVRHIPFLSIRSVSNRVEPRNRKAWKIAQAIENLNTTLISILETSHFHPESLFRRR